MNNLLIIRLMCLFLTSSVLSMGVQKFYCKDFAQLGVEYSNKINTSALTEKERYTFYTYNKWTIEVGEKTINSDYDEKIRQGYEAQVYIKFIDEHVGYGVFAEQDIQAGEFISFYSGMLANTIDIKDHSYSADYYLRGNLFSVDAKRAGNFSRFINHSDNPTINVCYHNVDGIWYAVFIANTLIKKDEQLLVNYGSSYWGGTKPITLH